MHLFLPLDHTIEKAAGLPRRLVSVPACLRAATGYGGRIFGRPDAEAAVVLLRRSSGCARRACHHQAAGEADILPAKLIADLLDAMKCEKSNIFRSRRRARVTRRVGGHLRRNFRGQGQNSLELPKAGSPDIWSSTITKNGKPVQRNLIVYPLPYLLKSARPEF
jgi:hypothetical protein